MKQASVAGFFQPRASASSSSSSSSDEALLMGSILVVLVGPYDHLSDELPVLIIEKGSDLNEDLLNDT